MTTITQIIQKMLLFTLGTKRSKALVSRSYFEEKTLFAETTRAARRSLRCDLIVTENFQNALIRKFGSLDR
jgi:hypothetical protein